MVSVNSGLGVGPSPLVTNFIAEDFYRNDYPEDEDAFSSLDEDSRGLREGLEYLGIDDRKDASRDPEEDDNWSEDENYEQYRDRIFGDLEKEIAKANQDN